MVKVLGIDLITNPKRVLVGKGGYGRDGQKASLSLDSYYLDQGSLKVRETWVKALKFAEVDSDHFLKVRDCNKEDIFLTYECPSRKHEQHRSTRPYDPCNDTFCLYDSGRYGKKKGIDVYRKLSSIPVRDFAHYVFTTPKQFWDPLFEYKNANQLKKVARVSLVEFYGLKIGGVHRPHVWGDKKPEHIGRREIHVHVIMPLIAFDKKEKVVHLNRFQTEHGLSRLRGIYKKNFCREFGYSFDGEIVVNYTYKDNKKRPKTLMNCCQYIARPPLELPLRKGNEKVAHFGVKRLMEIVEKFHFYENYRSLTWFGWMASHVVRKYLGLFKMSDREVSNFFKKHEKGSCPICGLEMELIGVYYRNKLVLWKGKDPPGEVDELDGMRKLLESRSGYLGWLFDSMKV